MNDDELSTSTSDESDEPWIEWYGRQTGNELLCQVDRNYIEDSFNLYGLRHQVPNYSDTLALILDDVAGEDSDDYSDDRYSKAAAQLYGLIHQRFILTSRGLEKMVRKYKAGDFGHCPRLSCEKQRVLPIGLSDKIGEPPKLFCPRCKELFHCPKGEIREEINGAFFGRTFAHLILITHPKLMPERVKIQAPKSYVPKIFGFRVYDPERHQKIRNDSTIVSSAVASSTMDGGEPCYVKPVSYISINSCDTSSTVNRVEAPNRGSNKRLRE